MLMKVVKLDIYIMNTYQTFKFNSNLNVNIHILHFSFQESSVRYFYDIYNIKQYSFIGLLYKTRVGMGTFVSSYVIGCDGGSSRTRKHIGATFKGNSFTSQVRSWYFKNSGPDSITQVSVWLIRLWYHHNVVVELGEKRLLQLTFTQLLFHGVHGSAWNCWKMNYYQVTVRSYTQLTSARIYSILN